MMALSLSIHAFSTWPISVDFDALRSYTAGFSVEETVEQMLLMRNAAASSRSGSGKERTFSSDHMTGSTRELKDESERAFNDELLVCSASVVPSTTVDLMDVGNTYLTEGTNEKTRDMSGDKNTGNSMGDSGGRSLRARRSRIASFAEDRTGFQRALQEVAFGTGASADSSGLWNRLLFEEITEQFNLFDMLRQHHLATPYGFLSCHAIPMTFKDRRRVVEAFYSVDDAVLKLFFGERMHKFELEDKSERRFFYGTSRSLRSRKLEQLVQGGISEESLKRQWENLKRVSTFLVSAYRGRDGMIIPSNIPLRSAIQRCFVLDDALTLQYATFVFGYEHRLSGRFWEKLSYMECSSLCQVLSALWCDSTQLMLRKEFCTACARIGRLLDENRVVSEMHQMVFGEAMRPRWQVQLDEVQRAIAPNTMVGTGAASSLGVVLSNSAAPSPVTSAPPLLVLRHTGTSRCDVDAYGGASPVEESSRQSALVTRSGSGSDSGNASASSGSQAIAGAAGAAGIPAWNGASPLSIATSLQNQQTFVGSTTVLLHNNSNSNTNHNSCNTGANGISPPSSTTGHHPNRSANSAFSRRFLLEFPFLMKCLVRVGSLIGNTEQLQEALDLFYTRVYLALENVVQRSLHSAATAVQETPISRNGAGPQENLFTPSEMSSEDHMPRRVRGGCSSDSRRVVTEDNSPNANSMRNLAGFEDPLSVTTTVLNTSMMNYTLTGTVSRQQAFLSTCPQLSQQQQQQQQQQSPQQQQPSFLRQMSGNVVSNVGANSGTIIVNDRPYLRELCMLLSLMPNIFNNLTTLSEDDHATCNGAFSDLILALKFMVQVCLASDDNEGA